ncbi:MAG: phosphotransferase family protein [Myxococcales bacterium]|nr:phosphotransferase family protein [Myxococcales bacterium]
MPVTDEEVAPEIDLREPLEAWLAARMPDARDVHVEGLRKPGAGESSDTQLFELSTTDATTGESRTIAAVLRCAPRKAGPFPDYDLGMQFRVMRGLGRHTDVPVPEALWLEEDPSPLGVPFLVMRAVDGGAPLDFPSYQNAENDDLYVRATPETRAHMWERTVDAIARLHAADWTKLGLGAIDGGRPGDDPALAALRYWRHYLDHFIKGDPSEHVPVFDEALEWLEANRPEPERIALCWGDAKLGNVLYEPTQHDVAALLDWEMASIGDPEMDLPSLHLSDLRAQEGAGGVALEGTPTAEELVVMYEEASGRPYRNFHYQLVFATCWRGSVQIAVMRQMKARGADIPDEMFVKNFPTLKLCELLELPVPGSV